MKNKYEVNYDYLRKKKAYHLREWYDESFECKSNLKATSYLNAVILPLKSFSGDSLLFGRGGVIDENKKYIESSGIDDRVQYAYNFEECETINKKVVYCGYLINHWGHFLVEAVSRLWYFLENDNTIDKYIFFVSSGENRELKGNFKEFLQLLGVYEKIEIINKPTRYKEVIIPELGYKRRTYFSEQQKKVFDKIFENVELKPEWVPYQKIYFSRSKLKCINKKEFGLEMIDDYYKKNGYEIVYPEKISLSYLVFLIRNASEVATLSGSLPHNMLFARDGQKLTIIERNILNNEIQVDVNIIKRLDVVYIDANIAIYPISLGYGPFIMSYKGMLEKYTDDKKYSSPDINYYEDKYLKKCFIKYMRAYRKAYNYNWFMEDWMIKYTDCLREAYLDGEKYYGAYLNGSKPFKFRHYFQFNYIKQIIKRVLRK